MKTEPIQLVIDSRERDLGGFTVRRILPFAKHRTVGPFIFLDHMGPLIVDDNHGINVRPHPHIGLATVTYLFEGQALHRDSIGSYQVIRPGDVNWMTAGRGIAHSERRAPDQKTGDRMHGLQAWVALPKVSEEIAPSFQHHPNPTLPELEIDGANIKLIAGSGFGQISPVQTFSDIIFAEVKLPAGRIFKMAGSNRELAIYVVGGALKVENQEFNVGQMIVFRAGSNIAAEAIDVAHFALIGGEPLDGPREIYWNFVSSTKERIERAKAEWREGKFAKVPGDEAEFIPLPAE